MSEHGTRGRLPDEAARQERYAKGVRGQQAEEVARPLDVVGMASGQPSSARAMRARERAKDPATDPSEIPRISAISR